MRTRPAPVCCSARPDGVPGATLAGMTVTEHSDLVAALLGVPGVAAAAVEPGDGPAGTLRLQLAPGVDEVDVATEVNQLLRSRFGLAVDTDRVRVVDDVSGVPTGGFPDVPASRREDEPQEQEQEPAGVDEPAAGAAGAAGATSDTDAATAQEPEHDDLEAAAAADDVESTTATSHDPVIEPQPEEGRGGDVAGRIVIERVQLVSAGLATSVVVTVKARGTSFQGTAEGTATAGSLNRAVAAATCRAVEAVADDSVRFDVEHVEIALTSGERTALVVVTMVTDRATQRLSGASVVREDTRQAVIRAVLAAVNRRLGPLLAQEDVGE